MTWRASWVGCDSFYVSRHGDRDIPESMSSNRIFSVGRVEWIMSGTPIVGHLALGCDEILSSSQPEPEASVEVSRSGCDDRRTSQAFSKDLSRPHAITQSLTLPPSPVHLGQWLALPLNKFCIPFKVVRLRAH